MKGKKTNDSRDRKANHGNHTNDNKMRERELRGERSYSKFTTRRSRTKDTCGNKFGKKE